jgi:hypothetical protein
MRLVFSGGFPLGRFFTAVFSFAPLVLPFPLIYMYYCTRSLFIFYLHSLVFFQLNKPWLLKKKKNLHIQSTYKPSLITLTHSKILVICVGTDVLSEVSRPFRVRFCPNA